MKKKTLIITMAILFFVSLSSAMTPCTDIYDECMESNPYSNSMEDGIHEFQAYLGYMHGCLAFAEACVEQE